MREVVKRNQKGSSGKQQMWKMMEKEKKKVVDGKKKGDAHLQVEKIGK